MHLDRTEGWTTHAQALTHTSHWKHFHTHTQHWLYCRVCISWHATNRGPPASSSHRRASRRSLPAEQDWEACLCRTRAILPGRHGGEAGLAPSQHLSALPTPLPFCLPCVRTFWLSCIQLLRRRSWAPPPSSPPTSSPNLSGYSSSSLLSTIIAHSWRKPFNFDTSSHRYNHNFTNSVWEQRIRAHTYLALQFPQLCHHFLLAWQRPTDKKGRLISICTEANQHVMKECTANSPTSLVCSFSASMFVCVCPMKVAHPGQGGRNRQEQCLHWHTCARVHICMCVHMCTHE